MKVHREQAELAYAFASKVHTECGTETDSDIRLAFYESFTRFVEEAMRDGPTKNSLLWEALSNLSSKEVTDPKLAEELLKMRDAVILLSDLRSESVQSRLPRLFHPDFRAMSAGVSTPRSFIHPPPPIHLHPHLPIERI